MESKPDIRLGKLESVRLVLLLIGSSWMAIVVCVAIHELGHVLMLTLLGLDVEGIYLNPFYTSWVRSSTGHVPIVSAAGFFFSTTTSLLTFGFVLRRKTKPVWLVWLTGVFAITALFSDGMYMSTDALSGYFGDASHLVLMGISRQFLSWTGVTYMLIGLLLATEMFRFAGLHKVNPSQSILLLQIGVVSFTVAQEVYIHEYIAREINFAYLVTALIIPALIVHIIPILARSRWGLRVETEPGAFWKIGWRPTLTFFVVGVGLVLAELIWFGNPGLF